MRNWKAVAGNARRPRRQCAVCIGRDKGLAQQECGYKTEYLDLGQRPQACTSGDRRFCNEAGYPAIQLEQQDPEQGQGQQYSERGELEGIGHDARPEAAECRVKCRYPDDDYHRAPLGQRLEDAVQNRSSGLCHHRRETRT